MHVTNLNGEFIVKDEENNGSFFRENIIKDLEICLKDIANIEIFEIYTFDKNYLPLIVIRDTQDNIETSSAQRLKHSLNVELRLITSGYENSKKLLFKVLEKLKYFKSDFVIKELKGIDRDNYEIADKTYILTQININFVYFTQEWSY